MPTTVTEALAELKTIDKRLDKKREFVGRNLFRPEQLKDPLQADGGSVEVIRRELQAIDDLEQRKVAIRRAIRVANDTNNITINGVTRPIADWLAWRRDVLPRRKLFLSQLTQTIEAQRRQALSKGSKVVPQEEAKPTDIVVNVAEGDLAKSAESLEEVEGTLDGLLSLKNATITIDY